MRWQTGIEGCWHQGTAASPRRLPFFSGSEAVAHCDGRPALKGRNGCCGAAGREPPFFQHSKCRHTVTASPCLALFPFAPEPMSAAGNGKTVDAVGTAHKGRTAGMDCDEKAAVWRRAAGNGRVPTPLPKAANCPGGTLDNPAGVCYNNHALRSWRNWHTRTFEGRIRNRVRVQVPSTAPYEAPAFDTKAGAFSLPHGGLRGLPTPLAARAFCPFSPPRKSPCSKGF